jgi:hypothetical protein
MKERLKRSILLEDTVPEDVLQLNGWNIIPFVNNVKYLGVIPLRGPQEWVQGMAPPRYPSYPVPGV